MSVEIFSPVVLPCSGRTMPNRLAKPALYEHLASFHGGPPNKYHLGLYAEWAKYDWGMVITGNIQISRQHLSLGRDILIPEVLNEETLPPFRRLAQAMHAQGSRESSTRPLAIIQLSHGGRQSPIIIGGRKLGVSPMAPSSIRVGLTKRVQSPDGVMVDTQDAPHPLLRAMFQQPREMTLSDIKQVQQAFIRGALTAFEAGFDGVQLHSAHGWPGDTYLIPISSLDLLAQFLNPKSNIRQDDYSVGPENALRMLHEIVEGIRAVVPKDFVIGVKINSADYVESGERPSDERVLTETHRVLGHVRTIALWKTIDFIEVSGGDYESPDFMSAKKTSPRQAFFALFAQKARECLKTDDPTGVNVPLILLTGGLRSPAHLQSALDAGHADLLGVGRSSILYPDVPAILQQRILNAIWNGTSIALDDEPFAYEPDGDLKLPSWLPRIPLVGASAGMAWYNVRMRQIATSQLEDVVVPAPRPTYDLTGIQATVRMWVWMERPRRKMLIGALSACCVGVLIYLMVSMWVTSYPTTA